MPLRADGALARLRAITPGLLRRGASDAVLALRRRDADRRVLPDFVILGAQKCGTSSLYARLVAHPAVVPAFRKEVHHFDRSDQGRGADLAGYRAYFPTRGDLDRAAAVAGCRAVTGEATPFYLAHPGVPGRIAAALPEARFVVILRDPVERAVSGYHHARRYGFEDRPVDVALDPERAEEDRPDDPEWYDRDDCPVRRRGYLTRGRYAEQLARWHAAVGAERVLVLETTQLGRGATTEVLSFLGIADVDRPKPDRNVWPHSGIDDALAARLAAYFAPHNEQLFAMLGRRYDWRS
jgi:hypothetical protein